MTTPPTTPNPSEVLKDTLAKPTGRLDFAGMRVHELALQAWLYRIFQVREGYPVPVVFSTPMDAFGHFKNLWAGDNNPFKYLLDAKDETGKPLYEPHPSPVRYPLICVYRKGWKFRTQQNFSIHRYKLTWPTVSPDLPQCQLGNAQVSRMPMAWDYRFQIDHFCMRTDTQAGFVEKLMWEFWRTGGTAQTWIPVAYPGWGYRLARLYLEGDSIESTTPEEVPDEKNVEFRTTVNITVEGFAVDLDWRSVPALWTLVLRGGSPLTPESLFELYRVDLRVGGENPTLAHREDVPPPGTCQQVLAQRGAPFIETLEPEGISSSAAFGTPTAQIS
jgi:hypothetical protein